MTNRPLNLEQIRLTLRTFSRHSLLIIAGRAAELVPPAELKRLLGDLVDIDALASATAAPSLLDEVRGFHARSLAGEYYEDFAVKAGNCTEQSKGTDAFMAEFDRLLAKCIRESETGPQPLVLQAFELLFALLRHIDACHDDVIFFANEGGSWQIGVNWRAALPAYFQCLAETASTEQFALAVDQVITDFADHDRAHYLAEVSRLAPPAQQAALRALLAAPRREPGA
jgi:hypothetical protein